MDAFLKDEYFVQVNAIGLLFPVFRPLYAQFRTSALHHDKRSLFTTTNCQTGVPHSPVRGQNGLESL